MQFSGTQKLRPAGGEGAGLIDMWRGEVLRQRGVRAVVPGKEQARQAS